MTGPERGHAGAAPGGSIHDVTAVTVDLLAVIGLMGIALSGLDDSYASRAYLVTGMIGVTVMVGWALLCAVQRYAAGVFLLVASVAFPVLGATAALHNGDWLGFPSPEAVADLLTAAIMAPGEFLTTIPPVDAKGTALAIPYVIGFVFGGASAWLALRTRRPALPVVPLLMAMVLCIALGTERPVALVLRAAIFGGVMLLWLSLRAAREQVVGHGSRGRSLRVATAVAVAVGAVMLASTWLPPVAQHDRVVLRGRVGSGHDVSQLDNPLAVFRKFTPQPPRTADNVADRRLLRVEGLPTHEKLRIVALDVYDGTNWIADNRTVPDDDTSLFQRIGEQIGAPRPGSRAQVGIEVRRSWRSSWLPLAGQLTGITFDYLDGRAQRSDVRYNVATQTGLVVGGLENNDDYHFSAVLPASRLASSMRPYGTGKPTQPAGAFLDRYLRPWKRSGMAPMAQVFSLARYLRTNGRYSDGGAGFERRYLPGHSELRLGPNFFGARSIVGNDEQYAALMALAAARLGVPARVVVGAVPGRHGWVRGRNVHTWVEVRTADGSWRALPIRKFMSHRPPLRSDERQAPVTFIKRTRVDEPKLEAPAQVKRKDAGTEPSVSDGAQGWFAWAMTVLVLLVGSVPAAKWLRRSRRRLTAPASTRFVAGWADLLDLARDVSWEVSEGLPRTEQARRLGLSVELARSADSKVFARLEPTVEEAAQFWQAVDLERQRVNSEVGVVRRVGAWWSLSSLLHSVRGRRQLSDY